MASIALRVYNTEIDSLITTGRAGEAIQHCRYILKTFPKHISTYRLLGQAYLENQNYSEAADTFLRLLSSLPSDYIAHTGLSAIREYEGNIERAIWHLERAYEIHPASQALQGELRRLYQHRDGVEPPLIRLSRVAQARMYLRGALFPQAIAELRAALLVDPERIDVQVLLARACTQAGQLEEAAQTSLDILQKLPYCLEATRILVESFTSSGELDKANYYRQRLQALDPYAGLVTPQLPNVDQVPDQAVSLEHLNI
jgi:tetratricopeptide (TPR) repeat protein